MGVVWCLGVFMWVVVCGCGCGCGLVYGCVYVGGGVCVCVHGCGLVYGCVYVGGGVCVCARARVDGRVYVCVSGWVGLRARFGR